VALVKFVVVMFIVVHVMGCTWFYAARVDGFSPESWVVRRDIIDAPLGEKYLTSLYWAFTTATTVGYGDISALTNIEITISLLCMMVGVVFYTLTISAVLSVIADLNRKDVMLNAKVAAVYSFANQTGISRACREKVIQVVKYHASVLGSIWDNDHTIFNELPKQLQYEVATTMYAGIGRTLPLLKDKDPTFVVFVMPLLRPLRHIDNEYVYVERELATDMFIITNGRVSLVLSVSEIVYKSFLKGSYFGEAEILLETYRQCNVQCCGTTDFMTISKKVRYS
jgi:hyperpolarization activated cyclic nucleotide-gated potassium channel 1